MRFNRPGRALLPALALFGLMLLPACDLGVGQQCTLIGCLDAINIELPVEHSSAYTVRVDSPTLSGSFECAPPNAGEAGSAWSARAFEGDFGQGGPALATAMCRASGVSLQFFGEDADLPEQLRVELDGAQSVSQTFSDIQYNVSQPNGPDCPPTCRSVALTLDPA